MQQGDEAAFATIYDRYWQTLIDFAYRRLHLQEEAEEIVQDVFIKLYQRRSELNVHTSLKAYLLTAIRYQVYNKYREWLRNKKAHLVPLLDDVDYSLPAINLAENRELENKIQEAIEKLPEKCRQAFQLSREQRLSNKQIAEELNISVNTVEKHIGKALRILRAELEKYNSDLVLFILVLY